MSSSRRLRFSQARESAPASPEQMDAALRRAREVAYWLGSRSVLAVVVLLVAVSFVRNGIVVWNWFELSPGLLDMWDEPRNPFQSNVLFNLFGTAWAGLGLDPTGSTWIIVQILITLSVFALLGRLLTRTDTGLGTYLPLAIVLSSGVASVLWREIGRYDALFIAGVAVAVLARSRFLSWLGLAVAALTSPEQLLASGILLAMIGVLPYFTAWRTLALRIVVSSVVALGVVQLWFTLFGSGGSTRMGTLFLHITGESISAPSAFDTKQGFTQFTIEKAMISFSAGAGLVWSFLGAVVFLLVALAMFLPNWWSRLYLVLVVVIFPIVAGFTFGEDRTRDISLILMPVMLVLVLEGTRVVYGLVQKLPGESMEWMNWIALLVVLVPTTYFYLYAEEPFRWLKELLVALNNGAEFPIDGSAR